MQTGIPLGASADVDDATGTQPTALDTTRTLVPGGGGSAPPRGARRARKHERGGAPGWSQRLLRRTWFLVVLLVLVAALAAGGGYWVSDQRTPQYVSTATVRYDYMLEGAGRVGMRAEEAERFLATRGQVVRSPATLTAAAAILGPGYTAAGLAERIAAAPDSEDFTLVITSRAPGAQEAADQANAVLRAYEEGEKARRDAEIAEASARARSRLEAVNARIPEVAAALRRNPDDRVSDAEMSANLDDRSELETLIEDQEREARASSVGIQEVVPAAPSISPASRSPYEDAAITAVIVALLGTGLILRRRKMAPEIVMSPEDASMLSLPLLAELSKVETEGTHAADHASDLGFAIARLRVATGGGGGVVLVASPGDEHVSSRTALLLAAAARRTGWWPVTLLRPADLDHAVDPEDLAPSQGTHDIALPHQRLESMEDTLAHLRGSDRLVFLDGPPLGRESEAARCVLASDSVILVVEEGMPVSALENAERMLALLNRPALGFVFVPAAARRASA